MVKCDYYDVSLLWSEWRPWITPIQKGNCICNFKFPTATLKNEKEMGEINFNDVLFNLTDPKYPISVESI